jgi:hypothetical protein
MPTHRRFSCKDRVIIAMVLGRGDILDSDPVDQRQLIFQSENGSVGAEPYASWHFRSASHRDEISRVESRVQPECQPHEISFVANPRAPTIIRNMMVSKGRRERHLCSVVNDNRVGEHL